MKIATRFVCGILLAGFVSSQAEAKTCKAMKSCREAVIEWCSGDYNKDRDGDGIPCENICRKKSKVDQIRASINCNI